MSTKIGMVAANATVLACLVVPGLTFAQAKPSGTPVPQASAQPAAQPAATPPASAANNSAAFVPLTQFPQITSLAQSNGFGTFVNTLYKVCIGIGAVLAVIMIMVAGVQFMTSRGSVSSNEKAKSRIQNAIFGLILVLAPTIVFGIINPSILNLNLGTEFKGLQQDHKLDQNAFATASSTSNEPGYLLVYKFNATPKSGSGTTACSSVKAFYFATAADCQNYLNTNVTHGLQSSGTDTYTYAVDKSCEYVTDRSYTVPYDPKSCEVIQKDARAQQDAQSGYIWSYKTLNGSTVGELSGTQASCLASKDQWDKANPAVKAHGGVTLCSCSKIQTRASCQI